MSELGLTRQTFLRMTDDRVIKYVYRWINFLKKIYVQKQNTKFNKIITNRTVKRNKS